LHAWDVLTPVEEVMRSLDDLVRAGKVLYIGISDTPAWVVAQANTLAELRGWTRFVGLQVEYSLNQRDVERDLLPMARAFDMTVTAWAPLGGGVLTGKYADGTTKPDDAKRPVSKQRRSERNLSIAREAAVIASEIGATAAQVAIAWVRSRSPRDAAPVIPIVGARTAKQLSDSLGALEVSLSHEQLSRLNGASAIELGFPHDFLAVGARKPLFGEMDGKIDGHPHRA
jgi:aryl-alcohol dehydrogenase-like predicted oxidoreductase